MQLVLNIRGHFVQVGDRFGNAALDVFDTAVNHLTQFLIFYRFWLRPILIMAKEFFNKIHYSYPFIWPALSGSNRKTYQVTNKNGRILPLRY